ncbi:MAG: M35 family metallopeptidase [Pseudomonadota bacterium]
MALLLLSSSFTPQAAQADFEFDGCEGHEDSLLHAYSLAFGRAKDAEKFIGDNLLYETWFGDWSASNEARVRENMGSIVSHSLLGTPRFVCYPSGGCDDDGDGIDNAIAFVYSGTSFEIHICDDFWSLSPEAGVDATDVIVHEVSHFHLGSNTDDHCYGDEFPSSCRELAINSPSLAIENADSYRLFIRDATSLK